MGNDLGLIDFLTILSICLQITDLDHNSKDLSNNELMKELQKQDREYLERIIENQKMILENQKIILKKLATIG